MHDMIVATLLEIGRNFSSFHCGKVEARLNYNKPFERRIMSVKPVSKADFRFILSPDLFPILP